MNETATLPFAVGRSGTVPRPRPGRQRLLYWGCGKRCYPGYRTGGPPEIEEDDTAFKVFGGYKFDTSVVDLSVELCPVDLFAKLGFIAWDVETTTFAGTSSDDGTDYGFGLGAGFDIGKVQFRGEYELYDTSNVEVSMLSMLSLGVVYTFN